MDEDENGSVIGDDPLRDGMRVSVRCRRDFVVTDAARLLTAARRVYRDLNPGATAQDADAMVTCAADVIFTLLEGAGLGGDAIEARLAAHEGDGLEVGGSRAQAVFDDPEPLRAGWDCFRTGDVFALPPADVDR